MKFDFQILGLALTGALLFTAPARAEPEEESGYLALSLGYYDFIHDENGAADIRLDYRHGQGLYFIKPWIGLEATSDGAVWGGAGIYSDFTIYDRVVVTASIGAGGYSQGGGKDLDSILEFRSTGEVTYRFDNGMRLGVAISHISNAGLRDTNPGVNVLSATYLIPLGYLIPDFGG